MSKVRVIKVEESVFSENEREADRIRREMSENGTFFVNIMSAPGSGKTTLLSKLIPMLQKDYKIGEMDVDIESSLDAKRVMEATGVETLQIHNGGLCHIDADMTGRALKEYGETNVDLMILENIGNLVCPAEFDTGAHKNVMLLSIPEGDDKPLKYPLMFTVSDLVLITKIDTISYFDFDFEKAKERILRLNPRAVILEVSAVTGEGMDELSDWFKNEIQKVKKLKE